MSRSAAISIGPACGWSPGCDCPLDDEPATADVHPCSSRPACDERVAISGSRSSETLAAGPLRNARSIRSRRGAAHRSVHSVRFILVNLRSAGRVARRWATRNRADIFGVLAVVALAAVFISPALKDGGSIGDFAFANTLSSLTSGLGGVAHSTKNGDALQQMVAWNALDWQLIHAGHFHFGTTTRRSACRSS